jgi:hypothetical protein
MLDLKKIKLDPKKKKSNVSPIYRLYICHNFDLRLLTNMTMEMSWESVLKVKYIPTSVREY